VSEGNGHGLVAPITTVYDLRARLEESHAATADLGRRCARLEAEIETLRADLREALEGSKSPRAKAILRRVTLRHELAGLRAG
jgi:cell division protein FtsB